MLARRKQMINMYTEGIKADDVECLCHYTDEYSSSGHLFLTRLLGRDVEDRNQFIIRMAEAGIATNVHFKPLPMHTAYKQLGFDIKISQNLLKCITMKSHFHFILILQMNR